jgi:hypothetical protein
MERVDREARFWVLIAQGSPLTGPAMLWVQLSDRVLKMDYLAIFIQKTKDFVVYWVEYCTVG